MIALDTNVVSELMRPAPDAAVVAWVDSVPSDQLALTAVSVGELRCGIARLPEGRRREALSAAVDVMLDELFHGRVLAFDLAAAEFYGELVAARERAGQPIAGADAQIAASCATQGAALATRNTRDFARTGVTLIDPWVV